MPRSHIDHLAVTCPTLEIGASYLLESLGVNPQVGGEHEKMGTHNLLLRLGSSTYLEVIAKNPNAPPPNPARWFSPDRLNKDAVPFLATWVVRTDDIQLSTESCSETLGSVEPMSRGDLDWLITVPNDGELIMGGVVPALIQWQSTVHPAERMENHGLSLLELKLHHPDPNRVSAMLESIGFEGPVSVVDSTGQPYLQAVIETPSGVETLGANQ
ncbi:VOC family protein [Solemya velesiana gill symbiont]|uniref:Glyoxalase-like domain-containing protein n=1 Tax=Solemya velesiana gill symbiont TaxID=1918948 RepID=A0A1T2KXK0_9GAMM|nr:VOC family protein [Solemya velesiana gill symbiont]OOZ37563.1 hypothetical protein BOW51_01755 [Solemya velesiana gill symbiont]